MPSRTTTRARVLAAAAAAAIFALAACGDDAGTTEAAEPPDPAQTAPPAERPPEIPGADDDPSIGDEPCAPEEGAEERTTSFESGPEACIDPEGSYQAVFTTTRGEFTIELDARAAPKAVNSFVFLARHRFYDGVAFHRIIPGFVVQGGDATGNPPGGGGPGYRFADELPTEGPPFYEIGSFAMANSGPDTNGSQFFIVTGEDGAALPPNYTRFGSVVDGLDVVREIEATGTPTGEPTELTEIESVRIDRG